MSASKLYRTLGLGPTADAQLAGMLRRLALLERIRASEKVVTTQDLTPAPSGNKQVTVGLSDSSVVLASDNILFDVADFVESQSGGSPLISLASHLTVQEIDGSPLVTPVKTIKVTNGKLTDNTGGVVTIDVSGGLEVKEEDGTPDVTGVTQLRVTNGKLTDNGGGSVSLDLSGGGGSPLTVQEEDGAPSVANVGTIKVSNGSLTDHGAGVISIVTGAPSDASYITEAAESGLSAESVLGTTVITTVAQASRQAAAKAGRIFLPSDGFSVQRDTGAAWVPWGPLFPLTDPLLTTFAWRNQGTATITTTQGGIRLKVPTPGSVTNSQAIREYAAPSTPYTIKMGFIPLLMPVDFANFGLCWNDGTKVITFALGRNAGWLLHVSKFNSVTSYNSDYTNIGSMTAGDFVAGGDMAWIAISDDGTNRKCWVSKDGQNWQVVHSVGRTDFLTPTNVGFMCDPSNASHDASGLVLSWKQTASGTP